MRPDTCEVTESQWAGTGDDLDHFYCCDPDRALCGKELDDSFEVADVDGSPDLCVVCDDLGWFACPNPECPCT